eukprot:848455-Pleurochrysis_carterae.AAC.2
MKRRGVPRRRRGSDACAPIPARAPTPPGSSSRGRCPSGPRLWPPPRRPARAALMPGLKEPCRRWRRRSARAMPGGPVAASMPVPCRAVPPPRPLACLCAWAGAAGC